MIDELLTRLRTEVPDCVTAMAIDLDRGTLLACLGADDPPGAGVVADVVRNLLRRTEEVAESLSPIGSDAPATPREMLVLSADRTYVCQELGHQPGTAVAAICTNTSNLGLLLAIVRRETAASGADS